MPEGGDAAGVVRVGVVVGEELGEVIVRAVGGGREAETWLESEMEDVLMAPDAPGEGKLYWL